MDSHVDDVPAGFKMTELRLLPVEWDTKRLRELVSTIKGKKPNKIVESNQYDAFAYLTADCFRTGIPSNFVNLTDRSSVVEVSDSDIVLIWDGSNAGDVFIGKNGILASTMVKIICNKLLVDVNYLYFFLKTKFDLFNTKTTGSTIPHINKQVFQDLLVPLPNRSEQRTIARVLSTIQRAIEAQDKVIAAARELKKSLMRHLFTYGPVPVDQIDQVEIKETEIGSFPVGWNITSIGDQFYLKQGKSLSAKNNIGTNPIPFLRTANVLWGKIDISTTDQMDFTEEEIVQYRLIANDLLVCEGGDIGRAAIWNNEIDLCCYQNHLHRLRPISQNIVPQYLMYWMHMAIQLLNLYEGAENKTTIPNLSQSRLKEFRFPLPTVEQQNMIVKTISNIDNKIQAEENRKSALQTLFKTMLHLLMTGKIRVKDLDLIKEH